jgi:hypothetical protein
MLDLPYIKSLKGEPEDFKKLFTAEKVDAKLKKLQELHADRLRRAIATNLEEAPIYGVIDRALNAAQENLPSIQARHLASTAKTVEEIHKILTECNFKNFMEPVYRIKDGVEVPATIVGNSGKEEPLLTFNRPLFDEVVIPLVASYVNIRVGKLYSDRNTYPRYKYTPPRLTLKDMVISDIVTNRVQRMVTDIGYADDDKQSIYQMAAYGICFNFPKEAYYTETYKTRDGDAVVEKVQREGVRFVIPHPTRHFWDRSCPLYTFNSDTGVSYAGYWDILKWSDIKNNKHYWNTDKVTTGGYDLFTSATWRIYQTYYPCVVEMPPTSDSTNSAPPDRIAKEQNNYLKDEHDSSVTLGVIFDKIVPKDWGLFDYDKPVWMRFVYANLDTCIYCEVLPYTPGYVYLDRYDANQTVPNSVGLTLTPFAQLLGNFITQHFQSVKQNLLRVNWVNTDIVPAEQINWLKRAKDRIYQSPIWLLFSKKHNSFADISGHGDQREAVTSMQTHQVNIQQLGANVTMTLAVIERMLGFSPQEVGAPASHEQSAVEVSVTANNTSVNLEFMGTGIDAAWSAKKRLLYTAFYCYGSDQVFAEIADLTPEREAALKELGFEVEPGEYGATHRGVKGKKAALTLDSFMSDREGMTRLNDSKLGIAMLQNLGTVASNQILFERIGPDAFLKLFNYIWRMVGLPDDFRLKPAPGGSIEEQQQQAIQLVEQAKQAIVEQAVQVVGQQMQQQVIEPITQELLAAKQQMEQLMATDQQLGGAVQELQQAVTQLIAPPPPPMPPMPPQLPPEAAMAQPVIVDPNAPNIPAPIAGPLI